MERKKNHDDNWLYNIQAGSAVQAGRQRSDSDCDIDVTVSVMSFCTHAQLTIVTIKITARKW